MATFYRGAFCALSVILVQLSAGCRPAVEAKEPLVVKFDQQGPYVILVSQQARAEFPAAISAAHKLHADAEEMEFTPGNLMELFQKLRAKPPRYAMVFVTPAEIDVNFAWRWLTQATKLDDDPFVDLRTGFITGATPEAAEALVNRIGAVARGELQLQGKFIDNLGPNTQARKTDFFESSSNFMIPAYAGRFASKTISHGSEGFSDKRLQSMDAAGLIHIGGHGHPDRVDEGLRGIQVSKMQLAPCVVFNGCCYTGVTHRWFEQWTPNGKVAERTVAAPDCFCLALLANQTIGYLAALHPDHGIPVYQEMEYLGYTGGSLGDVMKSTYDGVVLGAGGKLPAFKPFENGGPSPQWTPADVMLKGTAARILFGDPALMLGPKFLEPPCETSVQEQGDDLLVTATKWNTKLKSTFTDTFHADMAWNPNGFNDRALMTIPLPTGWNSVSKINVESVTAADKPLQYRLVSFAVEKDGDAYRLHVQIDVPTKGYMQSDFRSPKSKIVFKVVR